MYCILASLASAFNYQDAWTGNCVNTSTQQSPIDLQNVSAVSGGYKGYSYAASDEFKYYPQLKVTLGGAGTSVKLDLDRITSHPPNTVELDKNGTKVNYGFSEASVHFGKAEHEVSKDFTTDGSFQLLHKSGDGEILIMEFPFKWSKVGGQKTNLVIPKCEGGSVIDATKCGATEDKPVIVGGQAGGSPMTATNIFRILGVDDDLNLVEDFVTYEGSLTTPPCTSPVTWMVYKQAPRAIYPIDGYESLELAFPNTINSQVDNGNVRPIQNKLDSTQVYKFDEDTTPVDWAASYAAGFLASLFVAAAL